ncbi:S1C family serine protease [Lacipirellula limnantheis]|uniref:Probable periplasmic serine endoprotease DegP-like n=1 Tax=Lacipirellula limnantheis TaxID=2528024 RepID=A0A517TWB1_9BACT|nr:trypsin-like peptidase domain-containing protein [Lacipirellula limnantheis]QDT72663.1 Periplasmic serine endoprotease DegP precursor [Lacipirellula limnantheis]
MQHESNPHDDAAWGAELVTAPPPARSRPMSEVWTVDRPREEEGIRLKRLLWVFTVLTTVLVAPSMVYRIEYSLTAARERARLDVARANLKDFRLDQISAGYRALAQSVGPSVVNISTQRGRAEGQGSGVIVDAKDGYIVTNNHVIEGVNTAEIQLSDGRRGTASVVGVDSLTDLAVLKTEMSDLVAAEWGDSDELQVGDIVWALGSPFGLQKSITFGILSAKERRGVTGTRVIQEFLQTDAAVNPGNSGGPLVNHEGKIVGINTAIIGPSYQGISFAVPSELARASYEQLRDNGYVLRGFLGIGPEEVPDEVARELDLDRGKGVLVTTIADNSPASEAGIKPLDVILAWDGVNFSDPTLLSRAIAATPIGTEVPVKLIRGSVRGPKKMEVKVKVAARPPSDL